MNRSASLGPLLWLSAVLLMVACVTVDQAPQTFNERTAAAIATVTGIRQSTTTLLRQGRISADDAAIVQAQADAAHAGLMIAREMHKTDARAGDARLTASVTALQALQTYLQTRAK